MKIYTLKIVYQKKDEKNRMKNGQDIENPSKLKNSNVPIVRNVL